MRQFVVSYYANYTCNILLLFCAGKWKRSLFYEWTSSISPPTMTMFVKGGEHNKVDHKVQHVTSLKSLLGKQ